MARYNNGAIALHWLMAIIVIAQIYVGWTFGDMERGPERALWFEWHKTLGVTILLLSFVRLGWRFTHNPPPLPADMPEWEKTASRVVHALFYVALIALPLTGWATLSSGGAAQTRDFTTLLGGVPFPFIPGLPESSHDGFAFAHENLVRITIALAVLHIGAALKHQFIDKRFNGRMPPL
jgi:cytochrome b561